MDRPAFPEMKAPPTPRQLHKTAPSPSGPGRDDRGPRRAPGQPAALWASCLCLPATSNEVPEGTSRWRGTRRAEGSWEHALSPLSPWEWGFPAKALVSIAWTVGVRPCLSGESWSEVRFKAPLGIPSLMRSSPHALSGRGQWVMEPGKGEPPQYPPQAGGVRDPCTVSCRPGPSSRPLHKAGPYEPLPVLAPTPIGPSFLLVLIWGPWGAAQDLLGPGRWVPPAVPQRSGHCRLHWAWHISGSGGRTQPGAGGFLSRVPCAAHPT